MIGPSDGGGRPVVALREALAAGVLPEGARVVLALSGGRDSMALMYALRAVGAWSVSAVIVDHGLHVDSGAHAAAALEVARTWGVDAEVVLADPVAVKSGAGPEDAARRERYRLLAARADALGAMYIVTAHTADDQAETLLMRLGEGTGVRGMAGIPARRGRLVRPWLAVTRGEVRAYADAQAIPWVDDPTNAERRFLRNAVRQSVGPAMSACFGDGWSGRAARTARHLSGASDLLDWVLARSPDVVRRVGERVEVSRAAVDSLSVEGGRALVDHALRQALGMGGRRRAAHVAALADLEPGQRHALPGGWTGRGTRGAIIVEPGFPPVEPPDAVLVDGPGQWAWGAWIVHVEEGLDGERSPAHVARRAAPFPWRVRAGRTGEALRLAGAPGARSLRRMWADRGIPRRWRSALPVVESSGSVIWAVGLRATEQARVDGDAPTWRISVREPARGPGLAADPAWPGGDP